MTFVFDGKLCPQTNGQGNILILVQIPLVSTMVLASALATLPCLHNILWTTGWILWLDSNHIFLDTYLEHNKELLDFDDLALIFKIIAVEELKIHGLGTSVFSENILQPLYNMFRYNTVLDITQFKDESKKCIDYIEKWP